MGKAYVFILEPPRQAARTNPSAPKPNPRSSQNPPTNTHTMTLSSRSCRSTVALNNMGVTLLERRCFRDAMKNFRDGLRLINGLNDERGRDETLRRSAQCVASSASSPSNFPAKFELTALSHDDASGCVMTAALHEFPSSGAGFVVRLVLHDDEEDKKDAEIYYIGAMLHNYSVACRMQSLYCKSKSKAQKFQKLATTSAFFARSTLRNVTSECSLALLMLNLQHLIQLAAADGDKDKARDYYCELAFLRSRLDDHQLEVSTLFMSQRRTAAAA